MLVKAKYYDIIEISLVAMQWVIMGEIIIDLRERI